MTAFYNEIDPYAAQWLRNLIAAGHIAPGVVDERSIEDITPDELSEFSQCHFFAGLGAWSLALRRAGVTDSARVWTGSAPCQPFSAAGEGNGFADERHLWPAFFHLISQCRPELVLGEQVASKAAEPWLDLVHADLEAVGYAFGAVAFPSAGVGAPHIRDRTYWVADSTDERQHGRRAGIASDGRNSTRFKPERLCDAGGMAYTDGGNTGAEREQCGGQQRQQPENCRAVLGLGDSDFRRFEKPGLSEVRQFRGNKSGSGGNGEIDLNFPPASGSRKRTGLPSVEPGPVNGIWRTSDWLFCRDSKWRPVEPGTFPLVDGSTLRMGSVGADWRTPAGEKMKGHRAGRLKGYGNAINTYAAQIFIEAVMES